MKSMNLKLQENNKPKYQRIHDTFLAALQQGVLKPGERLPSTRDLAKTYRCHRLTVMNALQTLVAEGWLDSREKAHYFVSEKTPITASLKEKARKTQKPEFRITRPALSLVEEKKRHRVEFWGGQPDLRLFPKEEFRKILSEAMKHTKPEQLNYGRIEGLDVFRKQLDEYFRRSRGITDRQYLVTNGSQEGIFLIAQAFLKPGDSVAVEGKGYPPVWRILESLGVRLIPISVDEEGMNTEELEKAVRQMKVRLIYTTPLHQYPTTVTLSPRRRQELIQIAEKYKVPILEDDYDHEFHFLSPPPAPLATQTPYAIYIASFSKIMFPGARLGVVACHDDLLPVLASQKLILSRQTDSLNQLALTHWMKEGGFERHLRRITRTYEKRFLTMNEELIRLAQNHDIQWQQPSGGMSYWVNLNTNSRKVAEEAARNDMFFQNEKAVDFHGRDGTHLRIGFACVNESEIKQGFTLLNKVLREK